MTTQITNHCQALVGTRICQATGYVPARSTRRDSAYDHMKHLFYRYQSSDAEQQQPPTRSAQEEHVDANPALTSHTLNALPVQGQQPPDQQHAVVLQLQRALDAARAEAMQYIQVSIAAADQNEMLQQRLELIEQRLELTEQIAEAVSDRYATIFPEDTLPTPGNYWDVEAYQAAQQQLARSPGSVAAESSYHPEADEQPPSPETSNQHSEQHTTASEQHEVTDTWAKLQGRYSQKGKGNTYYVTKVGSQKSFKGYACMYMDRQPKCWSHVGTPAMKGHPDEARMWHRPGKPKPCCGGCYDKEERKNKRKLETVTE
jgi:hypothetical protein